jgi:hypothetical protein
MLHTSNWTQHICSPLTRAGRLSRLQLIRFRYLYTQRIEARESGHSGIHGKLEAIYGLRPSLQFSGRSPHRTCWPKVLTAFCGLEPSPHLLPTGPHCILWSQALTALYGLQALTAFCGLRPSLHFVVTGPHRTLWPTESWWHQPWCLHPCPQVGLTLVLDTAVPRSPKEICRQRVTKTLL